MIEHVVHIGITVSDLEKSIDFYKNTLGLSFQGEMLMEGIETQRLFNIPNAKVRVAYLNGSKELFAPPIELLEFLSKPQTFDFESQGFGKSKAVYFRDPDGIILELLEPID